MTEAERIIKRELSNVNRRIAALQNESIRRSYEQDIAKDAKLGCLLRQRLIMRRCLSAMERKAVV